MNYFNPMKWNRKTLIIVLVIVLSFFAAFSFYLYRGLVKNIGVMETFNNAETNYPTYPEMDVTGKNIERLKKGEYLVKLGDCIACHTNTVEKGKPYAGGLPMPTPFGTIYTPNISPDKKTGLGNWTDEQFIKAMREGISPEGHYYYPAFPYLYFSKISTDDLKDIKYYLDSVPAVEQTNRENTMMFPFNIRFLQLGWRILFFSHQASGEKNKDIQQTTKWNRGSYIVDSLGHCAMCHTPSYHLLIDAIPLGAPQNEYNLSGAKIQGFLAPNISESNLGKMTDEELADVFKKDQMIGGGKVAGPMLSVNHNSMQYLTDEDVSAVADYLRSVKSKSIPIPKSGSGGAGKGVYEAYCSGCHGTGAGGAPKYGDAVSWNAILQNKMDVIYMNAMKGINGMPAKGACSSCSETDIHQAVDYMVAAVKGDAVKPLATAPKPKKLTVADGKRIYDSNCAICHNAGFKNAPKPGNDAAWKPSVDAGFEKTYINVVTGKKGHPPEGACENCSDGELKAAIKYMLNQSAPGKDYSLW